MNISVPDQVVGVAFDPSVRRGVQSLPQHQPINSDDRFDDLLSRLAQSERESAALYVSQGPAASAALHQIVPSSLVDR